MKRRLPYGLHGHADLMANQTGKRFVPGREVTLDGLLVGGVRTPLVLRDKPDPVDGPHFQHG